MVMVYTRSIAPSLTNLEPSILALEQRLSMCRTLPGFANLARRVSLAESRMQIRGVWEILS